MPLVRSDLMLCGKKDVYDHEVPGQAFFSVIFLPFSQDQFCAAEGIEDVVMLSDYRDGRFGEAYELTMTDGGFEALLSRSVIVLDANGIVRYTEQVPEIGQEPDYAAALEALAHA